MEHRLITGGEQWLPFAQSCVRKLKRLGIPYADQSYEIEGASIKVRIEPGHEYIRIDGGETNYSVSVEGVDTPKYNLIGLTPTEESVGCRRSTFVEDPPFPTDWVGETGVTLSYFNGCPVRYRMEYPSYPTPAGSQIRIGTKEVISTTGGRAVLGAGIISYTAEDDRKTPYVIFATVGAAVAGVGAGVHHVTDFYYSPVPKGGDENTPVFIGRYAPYEKDVDFGRLDFREEPQAEEFPDLAVATYPDPWFFSPTGEGAVSAVIEPNFRELRRGFVANMAFTASEEGVTMEYVGKTDETYEKLFYPGQRVTKYEVVTSTYTTRVVTITENYRMWTPRPPGSIPTYVDVGFATAIRQGHALRGGSNGTATYETDTTVVDTLIGADYVGTKAVRIMAKRKLANVIHAVYVATGAQQNETEVIVSEVPPIPDINEPAVEGVAYPSLLSMTQSVSYPAGEFSYKNTYLQEDTTTIYIGDTIVTEDVQRVLDHTLGFEYPGYKRADVYVGAPQQSYYPGYEYGFDYRGMPLGAKVLMVFEQSSDTLSTFPVFTRIDGRYGTVLRFKISLETKDLLLRADSSGTSSGFQVINPGVTTSKITFSAVGIANRDKDCYVGKKAYYYRGTRVPTVGNTPYTSAGYISANPWLVASGYGIRSPILAWTPAIGQPNPVIASANADEWVYCVPTDEIVANIDTEGDLPSELQNDAKHVSSFAIRKKGNTLENITPILRMGKGAVGGYFGYVQLVKGKRTIKG